MKRDEYELPKLNHDLYLDTICKEFNIISYNNQNTDNSKTEDMIREEVKFNLELSSINFDTKQIKDNRSN